MKKLLLILLFGFSSLFAFENLTAENFDQKVAKGNIVVDFYAVWWSSCKVLGENLTKYNNTSKNPDIKIYKVDIVEQGSLSKRFNIQGLPALIYFKDGEKSKTLYGIKSVKDLKELEKKYFK